MLFQDAGVHYDEQARATGAFGRIGVNDTLLHPQGAGADTNRGLDNRRHKLRPAKDVHHVHALGDVFETRITFLTKDLVLSGIDRNDAVADRLQILGNTVAWTVGSVRQTNNGDGAAALENLTHRISSGMRGKLSCVGGGTSE